MKFCIKCKLEKNFIEFIGKFEKVFIRCLNCRIYGCGRTKVNRENRYLISLSKKRCGSCKEIKELSNFSERKKRKNNSYSSYCTPCSTLITKERRKNSKEKTLNTQFKRNYNISYKDYQTLLLLQNNRCKICKTTFTSDLKNCCIDHNHQTNTVRGLLCKQCNFGIGNLKENISTLHNAIEYIQNHNHKDSYSSFDIYNTFGVDY